MYAKKSLGQHFLRDARHLRKIADAADIQPGELVLEVGPGEGTLTQVLLERGARVVAVEKDSRLVPLLRERFAGKSFEIFEGDALDDGPWEARLGEEWKAVGNIPYYITGALLRKFLSAPRQPSTVVFLIQKEVAERVARSKKESILSLSVKAYGEPRIAAQVPRGAFAPAPKVDSAVLAVSGVSRNNFQNNAHEARFFELIKRGFSQKRKLLRNNLGAEATASFSRLGISEEARAEDLSLAQWLELSRQDQ